MAFLFAGEGDLYSGGYNNYTHILILPKSSVFVAAVFCM